MFLIVETHLTSSKRFRLSVTYRKNRPVSAGGGTAIPVRVEFRHRRADLSQRQLLECTAVKLHGAVAGVLVLSAYQVPQRAPGATAFDRVWYEGVLYKLK